MRGSNFWNKFRGIRDNTITILVGLYESLEAAEDNYNAYKTYIDYVHDKKDWFEGNSPKHWVKHGGCSIYEQIKPELPENFYRYNEIRGFVKKYGEEKCLNHFKEILDKRQKDIDDFIEKVSEEVLGAKGKIDCLLDYKENNIQWIINEVLKSPILGRYYNEKDPIKGNANIYGYYAMATYITGKDLMKMKYGDDEEQYKNIKKIIEVFKI